MLLEVGGTAEVVAKNALLFGHCTNWVPSKQKMPKIRSKIKKYYYLTLTTLAKRNA